MFGGLRVLGQMDWIGFVMNKRKDDIDIHETWIFAWHHVIRVYYIYQPIVRYLPALRLGQPQRKANLDLPLSNCNNHIQHHTKTLLLRISLSFEKRPVRCAALLHPRLAKADPRFETIHPYPEKKD